MPVVHRILNRGEHKTPSFVNRSLVGLGGKQFEKKTRQNAAAFLKSHDTFFGGKNIQGLMAENSAKCNRWKTDRKNPVKFGKKEERKKGR